MGDHLGTGYYQELPVHAVYIDAFYMDTFEVANEGYGTYLNSAYSQGLIEVSGGVVYKNNDTEAYCSTTSAPPGVPFFGESSRISWNGSTFAATAGKKEHPMVLVSWWGAAAYANWRSEQEGLTPCYNLATWECDFGADGYRLPTEAEWEKASRGGEHTPYYDYPWGNSIDGSKANYYDSGDPYETGAFPHTTPQGYYDGNQIPSGVDMANGYGLYDMSGSVWEWCNDWYDDQYYQACVDYGIYDNPTGPPYSPYGYRVYRGGSWFSYGINLRCSVRERNYPIILPEIVGFRLVRGASNSTVAADLTCDPSSGTLPFSTVMTTTLSNLYTEQSRRISGHIDVTLANDQFIANWRAGYTNVAAGGSYVTTWNQTIPAYGSVVGENVFQLLAQDVTPPPFNQPPYPPAGATATATCTVTGIAP